MRMGFTKVSEMPRIRMWSRANHDESTPAYTEYDIRLWEYIDYMTDAHGQQATDNME